MTYCGIDWLSHEPGAHLPNLRAMGVLGPVLKDGLIHIHVNPIPFHVMLNDKAMIRAWNDKKGRCRQ
ncbi:hypothetical protein AAC387_Pa03g0455 [Persea americana]